MSPRLRSALHVALDHILDAIAEDQAEAAGKPATGKRKPREHVSRGAKVDEASVQRVAARMMKIGLL